MSLCVGCGNSIPSVVNKCPECGHGTEFVEYPDNPDWWDKEYVQKIVGQAESETVTTERLTAQKSGFISRLLSEDRLEKRRSYDRPIIGYLLPSEIPHYVFLANKCIVIRDREESRYIRDERSTYGLIAEDGYRPFAVVTDKRILLLLGDTDGDYLASAPIDRIVDIEANASHPEHHEWVSENAGEVTSDAEQVFKLKLTTVTAKFEVYLHPDIERSDVNSVVRFIEDLAITSDQHRIPSERQSVSHSDTSASGRDAGQPTHPRTELIGEEVLHRVRTARDGVDWEASIRTGLRVGCQTLQYSKLIPYSTPATVGVATLTGTALKAHHTISGDSTSIDPDELLDRGIAGADLGNRFDLPDNSSAWAGASIGSARYLAERVTPASYKQLVEQTNPETIMKGAEVGTTVGRRSTSPLNSKQGAIAGACAGLVYSYVPEDSPLQDVDPDNVFNGNSITDIMAMLEEGS